MGVYSLMAEPPNESGTAIRLEMVLFELDDGKSLTPKDIYVVGQDNADVKQSAYRGAWIAYDQLRMRGAVKPYSQIARSGVAFDFESNTFDSIKGPSAGLCFLVRMGQELLKEYLQYLGREVPSYQFAATGILSSIQGNNDTIQPVGAITEKIKAALAALPSGGIVFYPAANEPSLSGHSLSSEAERRNIRLLGVKTPEEVLAFLLKHYGISAGISERPKPRWPNRRWLNAMLGAGLAVMLVFLGPSKPAAPPSLGARAALFYEGPESSPLLLLEGKTLSQGDGFKIHVEIDQDCYLYALSIDGANRIAWLFPPERYLQPLPRGPRWIPDSSKWFELDAVSGEEVVLVLATATPSEYLEERQPQIEASKHLSTAERQALKAEIMSYVEHRRAEGDTLQRLSFQHR